MPTIAIMPGRFHPFHKGHAHAFWQLVNEFGIEHSFVAISSKQEFPDSPLITRIRQNNIRHFSHILNPLCWCLVFQKKICKVIPHDLLLPTTRTCNPGKGLGKQCWNMLTSKRWKWADSRLMDTPLKMPEWYANCMQGRQTKWPYCVHCTENMPPP